MRDENSEPEVTGLDAPWISDEDREVQVQATRIAANLHALNVEELNNDPPWEFETLIASSQDESLDSPGFISAWGFDFCKLRETMTSSATIVPSRLTDMDADSAAALASRVSPIYVAYTTRVPFSSCVGEEHSAGNRGWVITTIVAAPTLPWDYTLVSHYEKSPTGEPSIEHWSRGELTSPLDRWMRIREEWIWRMCARLSEA